MNPLIKSKTTILPLLILMALVCFALSPLARATCTIDCFANENTVHGDQALSSLTTGEFNTAIGFQALLSDTTGSGNTAMGFGALRENTEGHSNTAIGGTALRQNATGSSNTATGVDAMVNNRTGDHNTATGASALFGNMDGIENTAIGVFALRHTSGSNNIALGVGAGENLTTGDNNIDIGHKGAAGEANTIRIGTQGTQTATFIAGISETPIGGGGSAVRINENGQLGTAPSSARFKQDIKSMDKASEAIHALKPVTFHYKKEIDPDAMPEFGLVAEEVEKVNPDLVVRDKEGKPYSVRYDQVNAMLLNEFLKEHRKVEQQQGQISQLNSRVAKQEVLIAQQRKDFAAAVAQQQKQIETLVSSLQKVSTQLEMRKPASRIVVNNH